MVLVESGDTLTVTAALTTAMSLIMALGQDSKRRDTAAAALSVTGCGEYTVLF